MTSTNKTSSSSVVVSGNSALQNSQERVAELLRYIRTKTDRLLQVMGTMPLKQEELDDNTLLSVDPIGIVTESFSQVLEHLHRTNDTLIRTQEEMQAVFDSAGAAIIVVNGNSQLVACNRYSRDMFFPGQEKLIGKNLRSLICGHENEECIIQRVLGCNKVMEQDNFFHLGRHYHIIGTPIYDRNGDVSRIVLLYTDITDQKLAAEQIERLAYFDVLTGLPNRVLLKDRLEQMMYRAGRREEMVALLFLDLDQFKEINDTLGHNVGDQLLQVIAERLGHCVRQSDTVGRLGGDEFVLLLEGIRVQEDVSEVAEKVLVAFTQPLYLDGREIFISASIGISQYPVDGRDTEALFKNADTAMYQAKNKGRNNFQFYTPEMSASAMEALVLTSDMRHALERQEFFLHYQPQINLAQNVITGVEALLRWNHPIEGSIPPGVFITLAEDTGLIVPIGRWVLEEACWQAVQWKSQGFPVMKMAVNISGKQFREPGFVDTVKEVIALTGIEPALLELELTESILIENITTTINTLSAFRAMGVKLAIDDFGTGYSSLSYLKHFPIDRLKIDKSFVLEIGENSSRDAGTIASAVIAMAHSLGISVIAEGVERKEQLAFLLERSCDEVQGYYFSRPLTPEDLEQMLRAKAVGDPFCLFKYQ